MNTERKKPEVTTSIILDTRVKNKDGKHPVKLRITYQRERRYYTLKKQHYTEEEYALIMDDRAKGKKKDKRREFFSVENRAIDIIDNALKTFSFEAFAREYASKKKADNTIQYYFADKISEIEKIQTCNLYISSLKSLESFDSKITLQKITPSYLKRYEKWMLENGNSYTTIGIYLRNLRHIIYRAIENGEPLDNPFGSGKGKYKIISGKKKKKALSLDVIAALMAYLPDSKQEELALKYWLFSYLCNGMNMADIANLRYKNIKGNSFEFIRQKTKDTAHEIPIIQVVLFPETMDIIKSIGNKYESPETYIFDIYKPGYNDNDKFRRLKQHIKITNKYFNRIVKNIGITERITTYWARHTYSTVLMRSGSPTEFISEQLGHSDIKVTKNYLAGFEDEQREKFSEALIPKSTEDI